MSSTDRSLHHLLRDLTPRVLGVVLRRYREFAGCEDAVQEALLAAATSWPSGGVPENPTGWLIHVACRRVSDELRAAASRRMREALVVSLVPMEHQIALAADEAPRPRDDTLELLFLACHPALSISAQIALTLRCVGGLTTAEIARAFFVPEATMAQRLVRAKQTLKEHGLVPVELAPPEVVARLRAVTHVLHLVFNEGHTASSGPSLSRPDLALEAIRLTRVLAAIVPADAEAGGLLALMLLTNARRPARTGPRGELVPLDEQDRRLWDRAEIAEGTALLDQALARGTPGPFQIHAAIAALHAEAASMDATDWLQISLLYETLLAGEDNPMTRLNLAIARAMVHGPEHGLAELATLANEPRLAGGHRLEAARAHLLERAGDVAGARVAYRAAAGRATNLEERNYLLLRAGRLPA